MLLRAYIMLSCARQGQGFRGRKVVYARVYDPLILYILYFARRLVEEVLGASISSPGPPPRESSGFRARKSRVSCAYWRGAASLINEIRRRLARFLIAR